VELRVAWIEEQPLDGVGWLEGSFTARFEQGAHAGERIELERVTDLDIVTAIRWAGERAGLVLVWLVVGWSIGPLVRHRTGAISRLPAAPRPAA
jgi:hypothetical protein